MKKSRRIISFITALAVSSSFVSCKKTEDSSQIIEESQPEVTATEEPSAEPVEIGNEYKLTCYYEEQPLSEVGGLFGKITDTLYGGDHMYYLTDDITYTSGSGYRMCNIDIATMQRTDLYNAPEGFVYTPANPSDLPEGVTLGENDRLFTVFTDRVLYGNEKGVCVKDIKTGTERVIEKAGTTDQEVLGAFFDGKKYIIVYQEKPQTLKHFYAANANGEVTDETKMTLGFDGHIEGAFVNSLGDLYFAKVERTQKTTVVSPEKTVVADNTKIELYRMKPDGTLNRMVGGETLPYNVELNDLFVSSDGNIFVIETDPVNGKTVQRFDSYGIRTGRFSVESYDDDVFFCSGAELWRAFRDSDGSMCLCMINDEGEPDLSTKISTDMGTVVTKLAGDNVYDAYLSDQSSVYGIKTADRKTEELMQWTDADVDASVLTCLGIKDAGDIYCLKSETVVTEETPAATNEAVVTEAALAENDGEDAENDGEDAENAEDTDDTEADETDEESSGEEETDEDASDEDEDDDEEGDGEDEDEVTSEDPTEQTESETPAPVVKTEIVTKPVRLVKADAQRLADINSRRIITVAGDIYATVNINGTEYDLISRIKEFNSTNDQYFIHPKNYNKFGTLTTLTDPENEEEKKLLQDEETEDEEDEKNTDSEDEETEDDEVSESEDDEDEDADDTDEDDEDEDEDDDKSETSYTPSEVRINGMQKLEQDMREGFTPDFIVYDPADNDFSSYAAEGKFADLSELIKDDPEIREDDFMENIAGLFKYDDVMYRIFPVFRGRTFVADESAVENKNHWKISEFLEAANVSNTVYVNEEDALDAVLPAFVTDRTNFEDGTCSLDNKDFRELLQWADAFPPVSDSPSIDYDRTAHKQYPVRADLLSSPNKFAYEEAAVGESLIVKGMPSSNEELGLEVEPGMCFSVLKTSDAKAETWRFIRQFFTEDFYGWGQEKGYTEEEMKGHIDSDILPVRKSVLDQMISDRTSFRFERMLNGKDFVPTVNTTWGEEYEIDEIDSKAVDKFRKAVNGEAYISPKGSDYYNVIREAAVEYFTSPDMTAEDASKAVQKAASAYLAAN
ncbi:hypothetical protein [Ruminococcus sp. HUN007]|uniref:hypothetical protein n=1 Tax=Ruminococcus sp. HUN007 TaxID=1514668 RepID=UPI000678B76C|nr:hypothetical protein [Ruminococcus sp. HUN007]